MFSQEFTNQIIADLIRGKAFYTLADWSWDSNEADGVVTFYAEIPDATPNTNHLRLEITFNVDEASDPSTIIYSSCVLKFAITTIPNPSIPTSTMYRRLDLPTPSVTVKAGIEAASIPMNAVLDYADAILSTFTKA